MRLLEAIGAVLAAACAGPAPGIVFLDDVHGADEATIDAISYLSRRLTGRPLLLAVSWRSEAVQPGHRLRRLTVEAARDGAATIVSPERLTADEVEMLVRAARPQATAGELGRVVYLESEGLPLFVAQYLAAQAAGAPTGAQDDLPPDVQGFLTARLATLGAVARQVLGAAAAIGRSFELGTLREASGRGEEELVEALEELLGQDVVREVPGAEPSYDFSHQKLRSLVYAETSLARRRLLHRRVATALAHGPGAGERAALVAKHLRLAGDDAAAAAQYRVAAEHAASLHAHADALNHLDVAVALGDPDVGRRARAHRRPAHAAGRLRRRAGGVEHRRGARRAGRAGGARAQARQRPPPPRRVVPRAGTLRGGARLRRGRSPGAARARRDRPRPHAAADRRARPRRGARRRRARARAGRPRRPRPRRRRTTCSASSPTAPRSSTRPSRSSSAASRWPPSSATTPPARPR